MASNNSWRETFYEWPENIPRRGIVVSTLNEPMPFKGFAVKGDTVLLDRTNPDSLGARYILIPFDAINCLKFIDPLKESTILAAGFKGKLAKE
jgi:hypothetical protein